MEFSQFGITEQEVDKFKNGFVLTDDEYNKFNVWYAKNKGMCSCVKTPIETIRQYFKSL